MRGPCSEKNQWNCPQVQNEQKNHRVLLMFCQLFKIENESMPDKDIYCSAYFRLVCSEMFSLFLLIGDFDLIKICDTHVWGP